MERDSFILHVYYLVVDYYRQITATQRLRHGGFDPELDGEEVMTMGIYGEYFKLKSASSSLPLNLFWKDVYSTFH